LSKYGESESGVKVRGRQSREKKMAVWLLRWDRWGLQRNDFPNHRMRVVKHLNGLPKEVVEAPSLGTFPARLDGALSTLMQLQMSLLAAGGWARWPLKVPSNPKCSVILWF